MRQHRARIAILLPATWLGAALAADGMAPPKEADVWPQWQARITVSMATLAPVRLTADAGAAQRQTLQSGALFSDYYFDMPGLRLPAATGGLRATSGLLAGARGLAASGLAPRPRGDARLGFALQSGVSPQAADGADGTVPYLGLGYTGLSLKGGWGLTADLGLVAEQPGNAGRVGRALFGNGSQSWDAALRDMRFSPVLQLGVNYAF